MTGTGACGHSYFIVLKRKTAHFLSMEGQDRRLFVGMLATVLLVEAGLRLGGFRRVSGLMRRSIGEQAAAPDFIAREIDRNKRTARLIRRNFPFAGRCLAQSLALWWFLKRKGVSTELRIGSRRNGNRLEGHAWIEYQGRVINDTSLVGSRYLPIGDFPHSL